MSLKKLAQSILKSGTASGTTGGTDCPTVPVNKKGSGTALKGVVKPNTESVPLSHPYMFGTVGQQAKSGTVSGTVSGTDHLEDLLSEVGAELINGGQGVRFKPYLAGPDADPDRWAKANDLLAEVLKIRF